MKISPIKTNFLHAGRWKEGEADVNMLRITSRKFAKPLKFKQNKIQRKMLNYMKLYQRPFFV